MLRRTDWAERRGGKLKNVQRKNDKEGCWMDG